MPCFAIFLKDESIISEIDVRAELQLNISTRGSAMCLCNPPCLINYSLSVCGVFHEMNPGIKEGGGTINQAVL